MPANAELKTNGMFRGAYRSRRCLVPVEEVPPDPADLILPFASDLMKIWPVSTRVNNVRNQEADLLDPI